MMLAAEAQLSALELALLGWFLFAGLAVAVALLVVSRLTR
jgi:hypothetical protein